ncbi:hypothetical protein [Geoglobus acetivorans]|uniref:hypothetical protein n=1 Tax=Geoglobus acetivorans TaxID=565033 RepID=UPI0011DC90BE
MDTVQSKLNWDFSSQKPRKPVRCRACKYSEYVGVKHNPQSRIILLSEYQVFRCKNPSSPNYSRHVSEEDMCQEGDELDYIKSKDDRCRVCGRKTHTPPFCGPSHYHIYLEELRRCENCRYLDGGECSLGNEPDDCSDFRAKDLCKFIQRFIDAHKPLWDKVVRKDELRRYMGPKWARVRRGAVVRLVAVVNGRIGVFRYKGEVVWCPVRLLHSLQKP